MRNTHQYTTAPTEQQLGVLLHLLDVEEKIMRVTVDIHGVLYNPSSSFFTLFAKKSLPLPSKKILKLTEFFDEADSEIILSILFQSIMWKRIRSKDFYFYRSSPMQDKTLIKCDIVAIPWSYLQETKDHTTAAAEVDTKLSRPLVELIFIPQVMDEIFSYEDLQQHRVMNLGNLSLGIAHDLNNLITGITAVTTLLQKQYADPIAVRYIETIQKSMQQATQLTSNILEFAKGSTEKSSTTYPTAVLQESLEIFQRSLHERIVCRVDWTQEHVPLTISASDLTQIFINLLINASDAITGQGQVDISGHYQRKQDKQYFVLQVTDNGIGMNKEMQQNIFKSFFTTKERKTNAGLGLTIVKSLVDKAEGWIECDSTLGQGTCFVVFLPVAESH